MRKMTLSGIALVMAAGSSPSIAQQCAEWQTDIGLPGTGPSTPIVRALAVHNGEIYAGGSFTQMGGETVNYIARWDGTHWWPLGNGIGGTINVLEVNAIASFDGDLYVGGRFQEAGGIPASRIARWDGELWHSLGSGLTANIHQNLIRAQDMLVWDDGTGEALYIAGEFTHANGVAANGIVRWDGSNFSPLGQGLSGNSYPREIAVFQNQLYAGGGFFSAGGQNIRWLARWDGSTWSAVPGFEATGTVETLTTFDDGSGEALYLYASGWGVYKFDGTTTTDITANLPAGFFDFWYTLESFDDGSGPALYLGGSAGALSNFAKWTGSEWVTAAGGVHGGLVRTLLNHDDKLYVGGGFDSVGDSGASAANSIAIYSCDVECYANCDGSTTEPILTVDDFTCFINEFAAAQSLPPAQQIEHYANCDGSTTEPILTVDDFTCFINEFAQGCP